MLSRGRFNSNKDSVAVQSDEKPGRRCYFVDAVPARRNQGGFRKSLRKRYGDRCMASGCTLMSLVEAAHILPYHGGVDDSPDNGLLLRADLHTLFDLNFLGIDPHTLQVRIHKSAAETHMSVSTIRPSSADQRNPVRRSWPSAGQRFRRGQCKFNLPLRSMGQLSVHDAEERS